MRITFIGSGNVATLLAAKMERAGHIVHQVYSRHPANATALANKHQAAVARSISEINAGADIYIISVADNSLPDLAQSLHLPGKIVVHTAGSVSMDVLQTVSGQYGTIYPLQSIRKNSSQSIQLPVLIDAVDPWTKTRIMAFARTFADQVVEANDEQRSKLHLAAVVANNFSNHLFALAQDYCLKENISFSLIVPLLEETIQRLHNHAAADMQTGPAIRKDTATMEKHLLMLSEYPALQHLYKEMSESIIKSGLHT